MDKELTLLYYSSNILPENILENFRNELIGVVKDTYPIISVTQKPIVFGENICVGELGQSYYNMYWQILCGVKKVKTKYTALVEDDSLYNLEHFCHRPTPEDAFSYNKNIWFLDKNVFWTKDHVGGFSTIALTEKMVEAFSQIFEKYPSEPLPRESQKHLVMEPGKHDEKLGYKKQKTEFFFTKTPLITLCYWDATAGWPRRREKNSTVVKELEYFGSAEELRKKLWTKSA